MAARGGSGARGSSRPRGSTGSSRAGRRTGGSVVPYNTPRPSEPSTRGASPIRRRAQPAADATSGSARPVYQLVPLDSRAVDEEQLPFPSAYTRATTGTASVDWEVRAPGQRKWRSVPEADVEQLEVAFQVNANALEMPVQGGARGESRTYRLQKTANWDGQVPSCQEPDGTVLELRRREGAGTLHSRPPGFTHFSVQFVRRHNPKFSLPVEGFFCGTRTVSEFTGCEAACAEVATTGCVWTGERDGTLRIWNARTGEKVRTTEQKKDVFCTALLEVPTAGTMWAGFSDGVIRVFNSRHPYEVQMSLRRHASGSTVYCLAPQIGGHCVFSGGQDNMIYMWDVNTLECLRTFAGHARAVRCLLGDADRLYSTSDDGVVSVWDVYGRDRRELVGHTGGVHHLVKTDKHIWTGGEDGTVRVWDHATGECLQVYDKPHEEKINAMALIGDKVWTSSGATLFLWDAKVLRPDPAGQYSQSHIGYVKNIVEVHKSTLIRVWTTGKEGKVQVWDTECSADYDAEEGARAELLQRRQEVVYLKERLQKVEQDATETAADQEQRMARLKAENAELAAKLTAATGDIAALRKELEQARRDAERLAHAARLDAERLSGMARDVQVFKAAAQQQRRESQVKEKERAATPPLECAGEPAGAPSGSDVLPSVAVGTHDGRPLLVNEGGEVLRHGSKLTDATGRSVTWAGRGARPIDGNGRPVVGVTEDGVPIVLVRGDEPCVLPVGPGGRPLVAHDSRTVIEPLGGRPQLVDGTAVLCGADGRPLCTPDGKVAIVTKGGNVEGPDGNLVIGPDGRTPIHVDQRGLPTDSRGPVEVHITPDGQSMVGVIPPGITVDQQPGSRGRGGSRSGGGIRVRPGGAQVGADGRTVVGPDGAVLIGDDGMPLRVNADGMACLGDGTVLTPEQLQQAIGRGPAAAGAEGADGPAGCVVDSGGRAVLGPDGTPVVVGPDGGLGTAGGVTLTPQQISSIVAAPGTKAIVDRDGRAVLGPDGQPLEVARDGARTRGGVSLSRDEVASSMGLTASPRSEAPAAARADVIRRLEAQVRQLKLKLAQAEAEADSQRELAKAQGRQVDTLAQQLRDQAQLSGDERAAAAERRLADMSQALSQKEQEAAQRDSRSRDRAARESQLQLESLRGSLAAAQKDAERKGAMVKSRDDRIALLTKQLRARADGDGGDERAERAEQGMADLAQRLAEAERERDRLAQMQDSYDARSGGDDLRRRLSEAEEEAARQRALADSLSRQLRDQGAGDSGADHAGMSPTGGSRGLDLLARASFSSPSGQPGAPRSPQMPAQGPQGHALGAQSPAAAPGGGRGSPSSPDAAHRSRGGTFSTEGLAGVGSHDGRPLEIGAGGELLFRGRPLVDADGGRVTAREGQRPVDSGGRPVVGVTEHGVPILLLGSGTAYVLPCGPSGAPLTAADGRNVIEPLGGRPQLPDGTSVVCGQDGRPLSTVDGRVATVTGSGKVEGPDGKLIGGPDGRTPVRIDEEGRPSDGRGPVELQAGPDGRGMVAVVQPGTPVDQTLGRSRGPSAVALPGCGYVGADGRTVVSPEGRALIGPDGRPVVVNADGMAVNATTGEPLTRDEFAAAMAGAPILPSAQGGDRAARGEIARLEAENAELRSQLAGADGRTEQQRELAASQEDRVQALAQQLRDQASLSGDERAAAAERRLADMTERLAKREEELAEADARRRAALEEDFRRKRELLEKQRQEEVENLRSFTEQRDVDMRHHSDRQRELISHIHQREDNIKSAEEDMQRRAAMQANLSPSELVHYYKYKEEQWAQIGGLNRQLHAENAALLGQTRDLQDRLQSLQFVIESRPSFLKVLYDLYKMCVHTRKNLDRFSKEVSARERPRRELLDNISEVRNEVVDVMNGNKWLIGNMFTEYELLHIGTSPSFFVPDAKRFNRFRPAGFGSVPATGRWSRTPTPNVGLPHGHDMNAASPRGSVPRRTGSPHPAGATHSPVSGEFPSGRLASPQRLQRETSYQSHADVVYAAV
eukprot:TRINITY_DN3226_c0_g2_i3.p1 TRINITY_DN3226_c0_g2~~TRINITY_DN3226_c0_g2_i3.p1  ORF type:complete len:2001 (+),score=577.42 TRINITY_DN3226_c0_g2_i3:125-6127(+)